MVPPRLPACSPDCPSPSLPCVLLQGEVVEIVLQNLAANANNGDYRGGGVGANRTAQEQHPFHLHGHSFWAGGWVGGWAVWAGVGGWDRWVASEWTAKEALAGANAP